MTALSGETLPRWSGFGCRLHGEACRIPWGYDEAHADQRYPYTVEQLAVRDDCPHRFAYATGDDYLAGWRLWRALRRDAGLSRAEYDVVRRPLNEQNIRDAIERTPEQWREIVRQAVKEAGLL